MKAMILAAGKGTRVQPITHVIPKPMIPILQKPVMEFLLELLKEHGFNEVMVNVSHLAEEIENYFRDGQRFGVEIAYSFEGRIEDGECEGPWVFYHPFKPRGTRPAAKGTMVKGQFHGDTTFHWPNGSLRFRCHLVHGKADGRVEFYWANGTALAAVSEWKMGRLVSAQKLR